MSEQNQNQANSTSEQNQDQDVIQLKREDYQLLLDRLDELEGNQTQGQDKDDIDGLLDEAGGQQQQGQQQQQQQQKPVDEMSNSELVEFLTGTFGRDLQDIRVGLHAMQINNDIDRFIQRGNGKHDDFYDYQKEIFKYLTENENLSVAQAYKLAKADAEEQPSKKGETKGQERTSAIRRRLPDPKKPFTGERPGPAASATDEGEPRSREDAATKAFHEVFKGQDLGDE